MKIFTYCFALILSASAAFAAEATTPAVANPAGHWEGEISLPTTPLEIEVDLSRAADKSWLGTIAIPAQGLHDFKLDPVTVDGAAVDFEMPGIPGSPKFAGKLSADSNTISGDFTQGGQDLPFKLQRGTGKDPAVLVEKLVAAARAGDLDALRKALDEGADVNGRTPEGLTPLLAARIEGRKEAYDFLAQRGADTQVPLPSPEVLVDAILSRRFGKDGAGAAVLVARDGKILFEKGYGMADVEKRVPVTTATEFRIGSVTKQFTASSILRLQEAGKLRVTDPLSQYFPEFPRGGEVTLQRMLTHTSGIHDFLADPEFAEAVTTMTNPVTVIDRIEKSPFDFNPGERWAYSNSNFFLLGTIVEKASGQSYSEFLKKTFFEPLGMNSTGVYHNEAPPFRAAIGYTFKNGRYQKAPDWNMSWAGGAGALYSTVEDLYRWNEGIFARRVLSEKSLAQAFAPVVTEENKDTKTDDGYGFGWGISRFRGALEISHSGGLPGFVCNLMRLPDQELTVVVLTNSFPQKMMTDPAELSHEVAECYVGAELAARPPRPVEVPVSATALAAIEGRYDLGMGFINIHSEGTRVYSQIGRGKWVRIFPKSETEFFLKAVDAQITFIKGPDGKVTKAILHQGGHTLFARHVSDLVGSGPPKPDSAP